MNQSSHYGFRVVHILGNVGSIPKNAFLGPIWRAGGTQAKKSAKFGQNGLCVLGAISKLGQGMNFLE